jgi:hypothetical protein
MTWFLFTGIWATTAWVTQSDQADPDPANNMFIHGLARWEQRHRDGSWPSRTRAECRKPWFDAKLHSC